MCLDLIFPEEDFLKSVRLTQQHKDLSMQDTNKLKNKKNIIISMDVIHEHTHPCGLPQTVTGVTILKRVSSFFSIQKEYSPAVGRVGWHQVLANNLSKACS